MSRKPLTSRLAPPTSAPSTSGEGDQRVDVVRLHAAAVDDVALVRGGGAEPLADAGADVRVGFAGLLGGRVPAGADGPHRLVGDDQRGDLIAGDAVEAVP